MYRKNSETEWFDRCLEAIERPALVKRVVQKLSGPLGTAYQVMPGSRHTLPGNGVRKVHLKDPVRALYSSSCLDRLTPTPTAATPPGTNVPLTRLNTS